MMAASFISAIGTRMLLGMIFGMAVGPIGMTWALFFIFGSTIYMAAKGEDDIQKWLKSCLWRKSVVELKDPPVIYPTRDVEMAIFNSLIKN